MQEPQQQLGECWEQSSKNVMVAEECLGRLAMDDRGGELCLAFVETDPRWSGKMKKNTFVKRLMSLGVASEAEATAVAEMYDDDMGCVDWRLLTEDIASLTRPTSSERLIALHVREKKLDLESYFLEWDPLRKGIVTSDHFTRIVVNEFARVNWSAEQLEELTEKYRVCESVDYKRFVSCVLATADSAGGAVIEGHDNAIELDGGSQGEGELLQSVMSLLRQRVATQGDSLAPEFLAFDTLHRQRVTVDQFFRVLGSQGLLPRSEAGRRLLAERYAPLDGPDLIEWRRFLSDIHDRSVQYEEEQERDPWAMPPLDSPGMIAEDPFSKTVAMSTSVVVGQAEDRNYGELLQAVRTFVRERRVRCAEFFRDDDPLRRGHISREFFGRDLLKMGFRVSPGELETLCEVYMDAGSEVDAEGQQHVRWVEFVEDLEEVFTIGNLEKDPLCDVNARLQQTRTLDAAPDSGLSMQLNEDGEAAVVQALQEIAQVVRRKRLQLNSAFSDFDPRRRGAIPPSAFDRALEIAGVRPQNTPALISKFKLTLQHGVGEDVDYRAFLRALQVVETGLAGRKGVVLPDSINYRIQAAATPALLPTMTFASSSLTSLTMGAEPILVDVLRSMASQLRSAEVDLGHACASQDRLRRGKVTAHKLKASLGLAGVRLSSAQLDCVLEAFRDPCDTTSPTDACQVNWRKLVESLRQEDDKAASASGGNATSTTLRQLRDTSTMVQPAAYEEAIERVRETMRRRRLYLLPSFADFDKSHRNKVSHAQFQSVLTAAGLALSNPQLDALTEAFAVETSSQFSSVSSGSSWVGTQTQLGSQRHPFHTSGKMIAYKDFCEAVEVI
jgi:Ca2+-binding EF-hand superfamily protein